MIRKETKEVYVTSDGVGFDKKEDAVQRQRYLDLTEYLKSTDLHPYCEDLAEMLIDEFYWNKILEIMGRTYDQEPAKKRGRGRGRAKNK